MATVLMHGPAFDESGDIVEREVPEVDVIAFENAGYKRGAKPEATAAVEDEGVAEAVEEAPKKKKGK